MDQMLSDLENRKSLLIQRKVEIEDEIKRIDSLIMQQKIRRNFLLSGEKITKKTESKMIFRGFIMEAILANGPIKTSKLFELAQLYIDNNNSSTFRSHIHRMKKDGYIQKNQEGCWFLVHLADYSQSNKILLDNVGKRQFPNFEE